VDFWQVITELVPTWVSNQDIALDTEAWDVDSNQDIALDTEAWDVDSYQGIALAIPKGPQFEAPLGAALASSLKR
jgi:hypothetical protein